jgi:hypothetical protein
MTRAQQRAVALSAARYQLRQLKVNLLEVSAADAHAALDDYARRYPEMRPRDAQRAKEGRKGGLPYSLKRLCLVDQQRSDEAHRSARK